MIYDHFDEIDFDSLQNNMSGDDVKKIIAFQIGQVLVLTDFVELYTYKIRDSIIFYRS